MAGSIIWLLACMIFSIVLGVTCPFFDDFAKDEAETLERWEEMSKRVEKELEEINKKKKDNQFYNNQESKQ